MGTGVAASDPHRRGLVSRLSAALAAAVAQLGAADASPPSAAPASPASPPCGGASLTLTLIEVYKERLRDLLCPSKANLALHDALGRGGCATCPDATRVPVATEADVAKWLAVGAASRATSSTRYNEASSRSHQVLTLTLARPGRPDARLILVDLAGSERAKRAAGPPPASPSSLQSPPPPTAFAPPTPPQMHRATSAAASLRGFVVVEPSSLGAADAAGGGGGEEAAAAEAAAAARAIVEEGAAINKSLSALGNVIAALTSAPAAAVAAPAAAAAPSSSSAASASPAPQPPQPPPPQSVVVPYRDSKLTQLLRGCLGGDGYTAMVLVRSPFVCFHPF